MTSDKVIQYIIAIILMGTGIALIQHSLNDNFFVQFGLSFGGLVLILCGNDWRNKILGN